MDRLSEFLEDLQQHNRVKTHFRGLLHILIGRTISSNDGAILSTGVTWRTAANLLKQSRWDPDAVRQLGVDPNTLPPRDRFRFWFQAIALADVAGPAAGEDAAKLAATLQKAGYRIGGLTDNK